MADPVTWLVIATVASVATTSYVAREQNMASKSAATAAGQQNTAEAKQLELQATAEKTQATADELDRQRTLQRIMSAQNAVFGSSGADPLSGSFSNLQTADVNRATEAGRLNQMFTDTRQVGFANNIRGLDFQTQITRNAGKIARRTNTINGVTSILNTGITASAASKGQYRTKQGEVA